jgi:hypothetical protein
MGDAHQALFWDHRALEAMPDHPLQSLEMRRYTLLNIATDYLHLGNLDEAHQTLRQFDVIKDGVEYVNFRYLNRYQILLAECTWPSIC